MQTQRAIKKYLSIVFCLVFIISSFTTCKKDAQKNFDYERAAGLWVPFEMTDELGTIQPGPFTASTIFGIYAESVHLNRDKTFIPVSWVDVNTFFYKVAEQGTYEYLPANKLKFKGVVEIEWEVSRFEDDLLWLKKHNASGYSLYKFQRKR